MTSMDINSRIRDQVTGHRVVLYMKGTPQLRMRFSQLGSRSWTPAVCRIPNTVNVLARRRDPSRHQGVRQLAAIPQLYVNGEFVGGSDIMRENVPVRRPAEANQEARAAGVASASPAQVSRHRKGSVVEQSGYRL